MVADQGGNGQGQNSRGGIDVWSIRVVVVGLTSSLILAVIAVWWLNAVGKEPPPALAGLVGTLVGALVGILARPAASGR